MAGFWIRLGLICVLPWSATAKSNAPSPPGGAPECETAVVLSRGVDPATLGARAMTWERDAAARTAGDQNGRDACPCLEGEEAGKASCGAQFAYSTQDGFESVCGAPPRSNAGPAKRTEKTLGRANPVRRLPDADLKSSR